MTEPSAKERAVTALKDAADLATLLATFVPEIENLVTRSISGPPRTVTAKASRLTAWKEDADALFLRLVPVLKKAAEAIRPAVAVCTQVERFAESPPEECLCPGHEQERFQGWIDRVKAGLGPMEHDDSRRMKLIEDVWSNMIDRFPLGIAMDLANALQAIHVEEDKDAIQTLEYLLEGEQKATWDADDYCAAWRATHPEIK